MNYSTYFKCVTCHKEYDQQEISYTCPDCGPLLGTLDVLYDYDAVSNVLDRDTLNENPIRNLWRYAPLLPISKPELIPNLAVGRTPLYLSRRLASEFGVRKLWIKDDGRNPTASYKDRASAVAMLKALEQDAKVLTAASTGNAASSWAAFATLAELPVHIFVPRNAPRPKLAQLLLFGANVIQVEGNYDDAFDLCCQAAEKWGWYNRSTAINPYLGEGKKTGAFEICEELNWQVPDYVFVSVGDGCILQGVWKGFKDFHAAGLIDRLPKIGGVQAEGAAPLYQAWKSGLERCEPLSPETVADSICVGVPRDQIKALRAVRESGGFFVAVSDEEILNAISTLARRIAVFGEPAGAAAFAGFAKSAKEGKLGAHDEAVVLVTGNGLKDTDGALRAVAKQPIIVENSIEDVENKVPGDF